MTIVMGNDMLGMSIFILSIDFKVYSSLETIWKSMGPLQLQDLKTYFITTWVRYQ